MDVFYFLNSCDVAEHLKNIDYKFSVLEKSFIIATSAKATLKQKHDAFRYLIQTEQDIEIKKRRNTSYFSSLFGMLNRYMVIENGLIEKFYNTKNSVFQYRYLCKGDGWNYCEDFRTIFTSFESCKNSYDKDVEVYISDVLHYEIKMTCLDDTGKTIEIRYAPNGEILWVSSYNILTEDDCDILGAFEGMWFPIPLPFKKGDILVRKRYYNNPRDNDVMVFVEASTWMPQEFLEEDKKRSERLYNYHLENGDMSDMCICGYFCSEDGTIYWEVEWMTIDYEFYRGELTGGFRNLKVVSEFEKDQISLDTAFKLHEYIKDDFKTKDELRYINLMDDYKKIFGI